jgi:hypothetical protein
LQSSAALGAQDLYYRWSKDFLEAEVTPIDEQKIIRINRIRSMVEESSTSTPDRL